MIWYPEIAGAVPPHILVDLFFDCLLDGRVIPDRLEHATSIGMALASVLSIRLSVESEDEELKGLRDCIGSNIKWLSPFESMFGLVVAVLKLVAQTPAPVPSGQLRQMWTLSQSTPDRLHLSTTYKVWLSRVMLQTIWRWRRVQDPTTILRFHSIELICKRLIADSDHALIILKTNCILILAISLGLTVDIRDLYAPADESVVYPRLYHTH